MFQKKDIKEIFKEESNFDFLNSILKDISLKNSGCYFIAGEHGSGRTTTLFSILNEIFENNGENIRIIIKQFKKIFKNQEEKEENAIFVIEKNKKNYKIEQISDTSFEKLLNNFNDNKQNIILFDEIKNKEDIKLISNLVNKGFLVISIIFKNINNLNKKFYFQDELDMIFVKEIMDKFIQNCEDFKTKDIKGILWQELICINQKEIKFTPLIKIKLLPKNEK